MVGCMTNHSSSIVVPLRRASWPIPAPLLPAAALLLLGSAAAAAPSGAEAQQVRIHVEVFADEGPSGLDAPPVDVVPAPPVEQEAPAVYVEPQPPYVVEQPAPAPPQPAPAPQPPYPLAYAPPLVYAPQLVIDPALALRESLRRQRIGGPIAMMATGLVMGSSAVLIATDSYTYDEERARYGVIGAVGFGLAIAGVAFFVRRLRNRSRIRREIRALETGTLTF